MRSFIDDDKKIAWIFDEETHPLGNARKKIVVAKHVEVVVEEPVVVAKKSFLSIKKK